MLHYKHKGPGSPTLIEVMENSSEQPRWVSTSLVSGDPMPPFSTDQSLLPPTDEVEAFYPMPEADFTNLPSYFSSGGQSRASSAYRHSPGENSSTECTHSLGEALPGSIHLQCRTDIFHKYTHTHSPGEIVSTNVQSRRDIIHKYTDTVQE